MELVDLFIISLRTLAKNKLRSGLTVLGVVIGIAAVMTMVSIGQGAGLLVNDAVKVAPDAYTVLFENERVRVLDVRMAPGQSSAKHSHPDGVWYVLALMKARFTSADGGAAEAEIPAGAVWRPAETHAVDNIGTTDIRAIAVELK